MPTFCRKAFDDTFELQATPDRVFPLLCPVREHDWIPTWKAEVLCSQSGYAELDCTFETDSPVEGKRTWICTRYEPCRAISYASYSDKGHIMCLDITLEPRGGGSTHVTWSRRFVATTASGQDWVSSLDPVAAGKATQHLARLLEHYVATGSMLRG